MNIDGIEIITDCLESECAYLPGRTSLTEYNIISNPTTEMAQDYLDRGWRRFGKMFFRPSCQGCSQCVPLRLDATTFQPTRSMRRALKRNSHIRIVIATPTCTRENIKLHNLYHRHQHKNKNWPVHNISATEYSMLFCEPMPFAAEHRYYDGDRLVGISYVDQLPNSHSSLYFFYDPEWAPLSPGIFSALKEIEFCKKLGANHYHLGYYVGGCPSMQYKRRFSPFQLLKGEEPIWKWPEAQWQG